MLAFLTSPYSRSSPGQPWIQELPGSLHPEHLSMHEGPSWALKLPQSEFFYRCHISLCPGQN